MADINVIINDATQVISQEGFGKVLVVSTTKELAYKEYDITENLTSFKTDFTEETEVYKIANIFASQNPRPTKVAAFGKDLSASVDKALDLTTALNTLITEHNNWYRILLEDTTETLIGAISAWCQTNNKMFYTQFKNTDFTVDFTLKDRTVLGYKEGTDRLDAAMAGYAASRIPGSYTFKFKNLKGVTPDALSTTELETIRGKNMNSYIKKFEVLGIGDAQLDNGMTASGEFIDHIESMDWVQFRIQNEIAKLLMTNEKVPYSDAGIQMVVVAVTTALNDGFTNGVILEGADKSPQFNVSYKSLKDIPELDRKKRKLTGVTFSYVEAGAIEEATINGAVVLNL